MVSVNATASHVAIFDNAYSSTLAFLTSLGTHNVPVTVYGTSFLATTRWSRYCTRYRRCPPIDRPDVFLPWLRQKIRSGEITRIAPTSDLLAYYLAEVRAEFPAEVQRTIPTLSEIETCLIKTRFADACAKHGIAVPETAAPLTIDEALAFADRVGYPLVLKAKSHLAVGMAERGAVVNSAEELRQEFQPYAVVPGHESIAARYPELRLPLLQRFIRTASQCVYSVSGYKDHQRGFVTAGLSYKCEQWPPKTGVSTHQVGCHNQRILRAGLRAVDALVSCGIFELELLVDDSGMMVIELNPRSYGFMKLDIERGNDLPWVWYQSTLGCLPETIAVRPLAVAECRQTLPFYVSRLVGLLKSSNRIQAWRRIRQDLRTPWISMTGYWRDPIPKILSLLTTLRHPGSLIRPYWRWEGDQQWQSASSRDVAKASLAILDHLATGAHPRLVLPSRNAAGQSTQRS